MLNIIKKPVKTGLKDNLNYYTVSYLKELAQKYKIDKLSKMRKQDLIDALYEKITDEERIITILAALNEYRDYVKKLNHDYEFDDKSEILYMTNIGMNFIYDAGDGNAEVVVPEEVSCILNKINKNDMMLLKERYSKVFDYLRAFSNLYGVFEAEFLINIFNKYNQNMPLSLENIEYYVDKYNLLNYNLILENNLFICETLWTYEEEFQKIMEGRKENSYYIPSIDELLKYSDSYYLRKDSFYNNLYNYLMKYSNDTRFIEDIMLDLKAVSQIEPFDIEMFLYGLERKGVKFNSLDEVNRLKKLCLDFSNNSPKWINKGWSKADLYNSAENKTSQNITPKVGRNELCPCGSGKKYKKCCGR